jgi:hypothetical protein
MHFGNVDIYNLMGRKIITARVGLNTIDISSLTSGIYLMNFKFENQWRLVKFIKLSEVQE